MVALTKICVCKFVNVRDLKCEAMLIQLVAQCVLLSLWLFEFERTCELLHSPLCNRTYLLMVSDSEVMQVERKWHILLTIFFLLITSGQCMDSKDVKQKERRTLLDLILQVIRDSQQRDKALSRRCSSGLFTSAQDMKFSSREKPFYVPRLDNSRLIGKLIRFIFRS